MARVSAVSLVLVAILFAGCVGPVIETPAEKTEKPPTATTPTRITPQCDTFGTGGIVPLNETNHTVTTVTLANRTFHSTISDLPDYPFNASEFEYVPRDKIDAKGAVRDELDMRSPNMTLYYFSPDSDTRLDNMAIVTENGGVFTVHIGAC